jgi:hypothetical protein
MLLSVAWIRYSKKTNGNEYFIELFQESVGAKRPVFPATGTILAHMFFLRKAYNENRQRWFSWKKFTGWLELRLFVRCPQKVKSVYPN